MLQRLLQEYDCATEVDVGVGEADEVGDADGEDPVAKKVIEGLDEVAKKVYKKEEETKKIIQDTLAHLT